MAQTALKAEKRSVGRPKKLNREQIKDLAQGHASTMINVLKGVATKSKSPSARVAAANAILDRAYGKPALPIGTDPDTPNLFEGFMKAIAGKQAPLIKGK